MSKIYLDLVYLDKISGQTKQHQEIHRAGVTILDKDFQENVFKLRKRYRIPEYEAFYCINDYENSSLKNSEIKQSWDSKKVKQWKKEVDVKLFNEEIKQLGKKYKMGKNWNIFLDDFVVCGIFNPPLPPTFDDDMTVIPGVKPPSRGFYEIKSDIDETGEISVAIRIFPDTSEQDVLQAFREARRSFDFQKKESSVTNLFRYYYLESQSKNKKHNGKFTRELKKEYEKKFGLSTINEYTTFKSIKQKVKKAANKLNW